MYNIHSCDLSVAYCKQCPRSTLPPSSPIPQQQTYQNRSHQPDTTAFFQRRQQQQHTSNRQRYGEKSKHTHRIRTSMECCTMRSVEVIHRKRQIEIDREKHRSLRLVFASFYSRHIYIFLLKSYNKSYSTCYLTFRMCISQSILEWNGIFVPRRTHSLQQILYSRKIFPNLKFVILIIQLSEPFIRYWIRTFQWSVTLFDKRKFIHSNRVRVDVLRLCLRYGQIGWYAYRELSDWKRMHTTEYLLPIA